MAVISLLRRGKVCLLQAKNSIIHTENGKRFAFRLSPEYILRTSGILEVILVENTVKGKGYDVGNNSWAHRYCSDGYQYHRHHYQYRKEFERNIDIKKATAPTKVRLLF